MSSQHYPVGEERAVQSEGLVLPTLPTHVHAIAPVLGGGGGIRVHAEAVRGWSLGSPAAGGEAAPPAESGPSAPLSDLLAQNQVTR